jgi:hypothetical protein
LLINLNALFLQKYTLLTRGLFSDMLILLTVIDNGNDNVQFWAPAGSCGDYHYAA